MFRSFSRSTSRVTVLSHFTQCVYLIFSAVYVCKESIEHVLLLHGPEEVGIDGIAGDAMHGSAHGSMGHGQHMGAESTKAGNVFEFEDMGYLSSRHHVCLHIIDESFSLT